MTAPDRWARIESVYHAALALPPEARAEFVARECGEDAVLLAEVESLLAQGTGEHFPGADAAAVVANAVTRHARAGQQVGPYVITALLGAGGMGEVYRARDPHLGRDVALKMLSQDVAHDPDRVARFVREARLLAALNHPNIAQIYGLDDPAHPAGIVMELVDGETLADRIGRGAIPVQQALEIARQIADALAAAHERGIIHRDLKPANIKVRPDGTVKVLDFGLGKVVDPAASDALESPTISARATEQGLILGTAAYMSPEQATGRPVDRRTDLWSFGVVLMEMLTGRRAFEGETASDAIASVLKSEPDWTALPPSTSTSIRTLLRHCLEKDQRKRLDSAAVARLEISEAMSAPTASAWRASPSRRLRRWTLIGAGAAVIAATIAVVWYLRPDVQRQPTRRVMVSLSPDNSLRLAYGVAVSPDGQTLAFVGQSVSGVQLFVRSIDSYQAQAVEGSSDARWPFFSPDGQWIGYAAAGELRRSRVRGGSPELICKLSSEFEGASWRTDDRIVFATWPDVALWRVPAGGGEPQVMIHSSEGNATWYLSPEQVPGSDAVLFTLRQRDKSAVAVFTPGRSQPQIIRPTGDTPKLLETRELVYSDAGRLRAVRFDPRTLQPFGADTTVLEGGPEHALFASLYAVARDGTLVYSPVLPASVSSSLKRFEWIDRKGVTTTVPLQPRVYSWASLASDGRRLAVAVSEASTGSARNIWIGSVDGEPLTQLTHGNDDASAIWSPDRKYLFVSSGQNKTYDIYRVPLESPSNAERLTSGPFPKQPSSVSPRGDVVLYGTAGQGVWEVRVKNHVQRLLIAPHASYATFSPDGRYIAYASDTSNHQWQIYVQPYLGPGAPIQVSVGGGLAPQWSHDGRELFYSNSPASDVFGVQVFADRSTGLRFGAPVKVFTQSHPRPYNVSPDGRRFLIQEDADRSGALSLLYVVQGWADELKLRER